MTKILLIEDEDMLREDVADWLTLEGYEVLTAADGVEGTAAAINHLPDLIISDIMMPRMDGYGVLLEIRANPLTQLTPFLFMTAKVSHDEIRSGMGLGADDYITKPFNRVELLKAIQTQLDKRAVQKQELAAAVETWRQALDRETEQRHLRIKMVGMFAHDFRNPLASIMTSIAFVRDYADRLDSERRLMHLNRAEASARQLRDMLDDMILFAQADTGSFNLQLQPLHIGQFVERLVDEFQATSGEAHQLLFECQFMDKAITDPRPLRQIVSNLVSNAIKYSPNGSEVQITLDQVGSQYRLTVQDHGIGIPEADQPRLFSAFQRGSNVKDVLGTGLGLAIVKQAVDLLGGSIHLDSRLGEGTTITIQLPIIPPGPGL